jgi:alkylation response protein AidB-like acyl-CoA dehydrogenase
MTADTRAQDHIDCVARAKAVVPLIEAAASRIDAESNVPAELAAALQDAGMYRMLLPRSCGGDETDVFTFAEAMETIARADASAAWCVGQINPCVTSAAYLSPKVADEIFRPLNGLLAWGPPLPGATVRADVVDGGYRVTAAWNFASGSRQATWLGGATPVFERDGTQRMNEAGRPEMRTMLFEKTSANVTDVWQVVGLRGTGSDQYAVDGLFIPEERTFTRASEGFGRERGPLYRMSMIYLHAIAFGAVAIGIARAMLDDFVELARNKKPARASFGQAMRDNNAVQAHIGFAEAQLRGAKSYLLSAARVGWNEALEMTEGGLSTEARVDMRAASTYAIGIAEEVVNISYRLASSSAIFQSQPFERRFRDMHAVTQQAQGHLSNYETIGQYRLGIPMDLHI